MRSFVESKGAGVEKRNTTNYLPTSRLPVVINRIPYRPSGFSL